MRSSHGLALLACVCASVLLACSYLGPAAPNHPELMSGPPAPTLFVEQRGEPPPNVVDLGPACPAEVGVVPTPFFREQLLIRLPPGLEGAQVPELSPHFARSASPLAMGCAPDLAASVFVADQRVGRDESMREVRERLFDQLNFPSGPELDLDVVSGSDEGGEIALSIAFPRDPVWGSTRVYLRMIERYGRVYALGFLAEQPSYHQLEPLFEVSAASMVALPG